MYRRDQPPRAADCRWIEQVFGNQMTPRQLDIITAIRRDRIRAGEVVDAADNLRH